MRQLSPTDAERSQRDLVLAALLVCIRGNAPIPMNDPRFAGAVGEFSYFFEGEDDLLHLGVLREDQGDVAVEEAQEVAGFLLPGLPAGVLWLKPGVKSQHFYFGHDELL